MRKFVTALCAAAVTLTGVATATAPAFAMPMAKPALETATTDVQQVQHRRGYYRHGGRGYYNGHRGYRNHRRGWRQHNGWWFPPAAFVAGAIIGGAIAQPTYRQAPAYRPAGNAHVQWCYNKYRSYRASDNTYQPYNGPRQQCYSPYR
ncbi:BA14K family protein [Mesorhizobium sp. NBSH29]|uniref:BA14K family protein n=1 Tax=Mesorhizobium sp. NBSH29 TaxID=2654249 RepID=UPI00189660A9|nr:BA14K family protein [Mesorhizobium sp. NBSH29]QPC86996.1 BA14K family protein [Mesorhizobium sp. NBSH29]